MRFLHHD
jgi:hypothetical protein